MAELTGLTIWSTFLCSLLSLVGSVLVVVSYMIARLTAKPKTAALISNLSITDFFWFLSSVVQSSYWISNKDVPDGLCYLASPVVNFCRMASLIWTCAISFDVLMSVQKRKWLWRGEENGWKEYRIRYYFAVIAFSLPNAMLNIVKQHVGGGDASLGCNYGYEELGGGVEVFFTELLPIVIGFFTNVYVFFMVRSKMSAKAFPLSVRKKRRQIMYHYIIVCIVCWTPTMVFYIAELSGLHSELLEVVSRISLYLTGFFNFLVFGLQDPWLKRSFMVIVFFLRTGIYDSLKSSPVDKTVMFGGDLSENADVSKDKKAIYRYHKLTKEDKVSLYSVRPDLDPKMQYTRASPNPKIIEPLLSFEERDASFDVGQEPQQQHQHQQHQQPFDYDDDDENASIEVAEEDDGDFKNDEDDVADRSKAGKTKTKTRHVVEFRHASGVEAIESEVETHGNVRLKSSDRPFGSGTSPKGEGISYIPYRDDGDTESSSDEDDDEDQDLRAPIEELFALSRSPQSASTLLQVSRSPSSLSAMQAAANNNII